MKKKTITGHAAAKRSAAWSVRCISILLLCIMLAGCGTSGDLGRAEKRTEETGTARSAETGKAAEKAELTEKSEKAEAAETVKTAETAKESDTAEKNETAQAAEQAVDYAEAASAEQTSEPAETAETAEIQKESLTGEGKTEKMIREYLGALPLEDKVSGLFIITPEQLTGYDVVTEADDLVRESLEKYPVAGLIFFGQNISDRGQVQDMLASAKKWGSVFPEKEPSASTAAESAGTAETAPTATESAGTAETALTAAESAGTAETAPTAAESAITEEESGAGSVLPPFLAIDEEGGSVMRIGSSAIDVPYVSSMGSVGADGDPEAAYEAGSTIGAYLQELGFNLDFAPDADVLVDPGNMTIGDRSFGSDPELCGRMVHRYVDGLHENGIASCLKHFPGLGDTESDTHTGAAWSSRTIEDYRMISHLSNSELSDSDLPASLNKTVITDLLRTELGYEGIVITDSLRMGAVTERFDSAEAAVTAIEAGVDILLMPSDFNAARQGILDAVHDGRISEERIDESLYRILCARAALAKPLEKQE